MSPTMTDPPVGGGPLGTASVAVAVVVVVAVVIVDAGAGAGVDAGAGAGAGVGVDAQEMHRATSGITARPNIAPHLPWNTGLRFSANAASASRRSSLTTVRS